MLVYGQELTLVMDYEKYGGSIMKKLLKITEKVLQLRKVTKRII